MKKTDSQKLRMSSHKLCETGSANHHHQAIINWQVLVFINHQTGLSVLWELDFSSPQFFQVVVSGSVRPTAQGENEPSLDKVSLVCKGGSEQQFVKVKTLNVQLFSVRLQYVV